MTFLPIIERELRERSRNRLTWWLRLGVGVTGALICIPQFSYIDRYLTTASVGRGVFDGLILTASLLSLGSCILTTESVSIERREGTLGLLLLTRVKTLDVFIGKLGAVGIVAFCALLAFTPTLMIPLLAGGVTGGEAARKALALADILFFALTVGLCAAAGQPERFKAGRRAVLIILGFLLLPHLVAWLAFSWSSQFAHLATTPSPIALLIAAGDGEYKSSAGLYWGSLAVVGFIGFLFLFLAGRQFKHGMQQAASSDATPLPAPAVAAIRRSPGRSWRAVEGKRTPIEWLVRRQRGLRAILWSAGAVAILNYGIFGFMFRYIRSGIGVNTPVALASAGIQGALVAWAASRFFLEARRSSELELLLTTPLGAGAIVSAQWQTLKRMLWGPMLLMILPPLLQTFIMLNYYSRVSSFQWLPIYYLFGAVGVVFKMYATCWLGMWFGLRAAGQARAILYTIGVAAVVPYVLQVLLTMFFHSLLGATSRTWLAVWILPQALDLLFYLWLIRYARRRLNQTFVCRTAEGHRWALA